MMKFLNAAAQWADQKAVDVKFARDEYDGWFAILSFTDARGPFSATVNEMPMRPKETDDAYEDRIGKAMSSASASARANRIKLLTRSALRHAA